jgi:hypothetical protein
VAYEKRNSDSFWDHLEPHRLCVPRYQNVGYGVPVLPGRR